MATQKTSAHSRALGKDRLDTATAYLKHHADKLRPLDRETRIVATLAALICDENGFVSEAKIADAMADNTLVSAAELLVSAVFA